ncbi:hypothetical protein AKO1_003264 [Acrasis kona]|uniref:Zinc finger CCCH domain-containing protein n=1 Tax=Acrasis kona TaxID=1008807 RepID=A0AAW2YQ53_9EUKA
MKQCIFFLQGRCRNGNNCQFSHQTDSQHTEQRQDRRESPQRSPPPPRYPHPNDEYVRREYEPPPRRQHYPPHPPHPYYDVRPTRSAPYHHPREYIERRYSRSPEPYSSIDNRHAPVCSFFMTRGCRYGDNCRNYHPQPERKYHYPRPHYYNSPEYEKDPYEYGYSQRQINTLLSQGVKPWEDDADDVLNVLGML